MKKNGRPIRGTHVDIDDEGNITKGPDALKNKFNKSNLSKKDQQEYKSKPSSSNKSDDEKDFTKEEQELCQKGGISIGKSNKYSYFRLRVNPTNGNVTVSNYGPMGFVGNVGTYKNFSKDALQKTLDKSEYNDIHNYDVNNIDDSVMKNIESAVSKIRNKS